MEVTYASGTKEVLYLSDFASGAMLRNIVDRAKKLAIKTELNGEPGGLSAALLGRAVHEEMSENEDLPDTMNPDDWARVSGRKGERIVFLRTFTEPAGRSRFRRQAEPEAPASRQREHTAPQQHGHTQEQQGDHDEHRLSGLAAEQPQDHPAEHGDQPHHHTAGNLRSGPAGGDQDQPRRRAGGQERPGGARDPGHVQPLGVAGPAQHGEDHHDHQIGQDRGHAGEHDTGFSWYSSPPPWVSRTGRRPAAGHLRDILAHPGTGRVHPARGVPCQSCR